MERLLILMMEVLLVTFVLLVTVYPVYLDIVTDVRNNIKYHNQEFWAERYFKHIVLDGKNVRLELDRDDKMAIVDAIFESALEEDRYLDDVELAMLEEVLNNCDFANRVEREHAFKHFEDYKMYKAEGNKAVNCCTRLTVCYVQFSLCTNS